MSSELFETRVSIDAREVRRITGTAGGISQAAETAYTGDEEGTDNGSDRISPAASHAIATGSYHRQPGLQTDRQTIGNEGEAKAEVDNGDDVPEGQKSGSDADQDYTEQLVLFDSLTASLPEVLGPLNTPSETAEMLAVAGVPSSTLGLLTEGRHLYHCIQHPKKLHPDFDPVLRGVLRSDPNAKILLTARSKVCSSVQSGTEIWQYDESSALPCRGGSTLLPRRSQRGAGPALSSRAPGCLGAAVIL